MLKVLGAQSVVNFESEEGAAKRHTEESSKSAGHTAQGVLTDEVLILLFEEGDAHPAGDASANGDEGSFRAEGTAAKNGKLRGGDHGRSVTHGYVTHLMHAFDCVSKVTRKTEELDGNANECSTNHAHNRNPEPMKAWKPDGDVVS